MKNLIYKELKLVLAPATYFFALCAALLLVPDYPYFLSVSYCVFPLLITFATARANNDHLFTAMLPIERKDIVTAKHLTLTFVELLQTFLAIPFAILSAFVVNTKGNSIGIDANLTFFAFTFITFAVFNIIFLPWYFKTGYKTGKPMTVAMIVYFLIWIILEVLLIVCPNIKVVLDGYQTEFILYRLILLAVGIIMYVLSLFFSIKLSVKNFERVSL